MEKVTKWGGQRPGAGRLPKKDATHPRTFCIADSDWDKAKRIAEEEGKTVSRWITELVQDKIKRHEQK